MNLQREPRRVRRECDLLYGRREVSIPSAKLVPHVVDFDHPESWAEQLTGDVLFSCLGTDFLRMIYTV